MSKVKKKNERNKTKQHKTTVQKHNRRMSSDFPYFFETLIINTKDIVFRSFQRSDVIGGPIVDVSV